jgi:Zn-dependent protease
MSRVGVNINLVLMALNLLPVPPLDGGRIAMSLLPGRAAHALSRLEPYGLFVILALVMIPGALGTVLAPLIRAGEALILAILGR